MSEMVLTQVRKADPGYLIRVLQFAINAACLCLPALINRAPLVFPDTRAYFMGGHAAIEKIVSLFAHHSGDGAKGAFVESIQQARGVRSAFYSLFTYIPTVSVSIWLVIVLQAMIVVGVLRLAFGLARVDRDGWRTTGSIVALAALTTVSWATSNVMPDIFTAVMALSIIMTLVYWQHLTPVTALALFVTVTASMVMHITNLPIGLGLLTIAILVLGRQAWRDRLAFISTAGALGLGALAMLAVGVVGFKQWSLAPQSPPFLTAKSIEDGPGRLYLQEHCPAAGLLMCKHLDKLSQPTEKFIWDSDGVYSAISPEERAQMRAEDKRLYLAAFRDHPWMQLEAMGRSALEQLITFGSTEYMIPSWADNTDDQMTLHMPEQGSWHMVATIIDYAVVLASIGLIAAMWGGLSRSQKQFTLLIAGTVLLEAAAGVVSEPVPRYEARVIWLLPLTVLLFWDKESFS